MPIYNPPKQSTLGNTLQSIGSVGTTVGAALASSGIATVPGVIIAGASQAMNAIGSIINANQEVKIKEAQNKYNMLVQGQEALNRASMNNQIIKNGINNINRLSSFDEGISNGTNLINNKLI